ncbi:MAG: Fic family protein [Lewinellaceae bacterium]|nr:Fic family protein [Lewinella sp.]MCB9280928.1 Fic family protein [Lewinellaceae bacterium]
MIHKYYEGTPQIINLSTEIGRLLGVVDATHLRKPQTELRKKNRVKTIRASLAIEGNTLNEDQVTAIIDHKRVIGPSRDIKEVENAIQVYDRLSTFDAFSKESYLEAHRLLMSGLVDLPGQFRTGSVGVMQGDRIAHLAPPGWNVDNLMTNLFIYLKQGQDNLIIKSCVFHYEMEFIHPFMDGNGRMGRLWQTVILMKANPVFEYLPVEQEIKKSQEEYYNVLSQCDKEGLSTKFVEYLLGKIKLSLAELVDTQRDNFTETERLNYFLDQIGMTAFTRKDYLKVFPKISTATATRDLRKGVEEGMLIRKGADRLTSYQKK